MQWRCKTAFAEAASPGFVPGEHQLSKAAAPPTACCFRMLASPHAAHLPLQVSANPPATQFQLQFVVFALGTGVLMACSMIGLLWKVGGCLWEVGG
jgi:hypothetical protein